MKGPVLHVAAMPFPSPQGTQAAVRAMLEALAAAGHDVHLATYAHGTALGPTPYTVHRIGDFPRDRSLRSGPSLRKLALDVRLARLVHSLRPSLVVAHHAEAMLACLAARVRPVIYVAHTALGPELPAYFGGLTPLSLVGSALDRFLIRHADVACAVAPALANHLEEVAERRVRVLPLPWPPTSLSRVEERKDRGSPNPPRTDRLPVVLYAGNLDAYQGLETLQEAVGRIPARLLIATESDSSHLPLATEADRVRAHAAADVVVVPRAFPGGVSVKLLDALHRGVPVVAARRATGGLALGDAALVVADDDADALAVGVRTLLAAPSARASLIAAGRAYLAREHSGARFVEVFDDAVRNAR